MPLGLLPPVWTASPEVGCRIVTSAEPLFVGGQHPNPRSAPANILSQEKDEYRRAHLRGEARSPEKSTSSYEGCPCRRRRADDALTSAEPLLAGGQHPIARSAPANILSQEEDKYRRAHLRGEARSPEKSTSSYEGCPCRSRRADDTLTSAEPLFAGGQHPNPRSAPANILSQEEDKYRRAHLRGKARSPEKSASSYEGCPCRSRLGGGHTHIRRALVRRRTASESALSSGQHSLAGGRQIPKSPPPGRGALPGEERQLR